MADNIDPDVPTARRRRSETRRRTASVSARLLPSERTAIEFAAEAAGCGIGTWSREILTRAAGEPVPARRAARTDLARAIGRWTGAVGQIGNNINQIARAVNMDGKVDPDVLSRLTAEIRALHTTVTSYENDGGNKAGTS